MSPKIQDVLISSHDTGVGDAPRKLLILQGHYPHMGVVVLGGSNVG